MKKQEARVLMLVVAVGFSSVTLSQPTKADYYMSNYSFSATPAITDPHNWGDTVYGEASPVDSTGNGGLTAGSSPTYPSQPYVQVNSSSHAEYAWDPSYPGEAPKDYHGIYQYAYQATSSGATSSDRLYGYYSAFAGSGHRTGDYRVQYGSTSQSGVTVDTLQERRPGGQTCAEDTSTFMSWSVTSNSGSTILLSQQGMTAFTMQFLYP